MNITVIFAHPWDSSLNKSILDKVMDKLEKNGDEVSLIDLYSDGFDPVMFERDLSLYSK